MSNRNVCFRSTLVRHNKRRKADTLIKFSYQCIPALEKANGILGRLRLKVPCIRSWKLVNNEGKNTFAAGNRPAFSSVLFSPRMKRMKAASFQPCGFSLPAHVGIATVWPSSWQSAGCSPSVTSQQLNHQISAFPAVTQNNLNPTLPFNYLSLIPIPSTWWYSFSVSKCIFTSSLFIILATLYLCVFTVLLEFLLCKISSAVMGSGQCLSSVSDRLQNFGVFLRTNVCPAFGKPIGCGQCYTCFVCCICSEADLQEHPAVLCEEVETSTKKRERGRWARASIANVPSLIISWSFTLLSCSTDRHCVCREMFLTIAFLTSNVLQIIF